MPGKLILDYTHTWLDNQCDDAILQETGQNVKVEPLSTEWVAIDEISQAQLRVSM